MADKRHVYGDDPKDWDQDFDGPLDYRLPVLRPIRDPEEQAKIQREYGVTPQDPDEHEWVSSHAIALYRAGKPVNTFKLQAEYRRLKKEGKL